MNCHELLTLIQSCHAILMFLANRGLLVARRRCSCGNQMGYEMITLMTVVTGNVQWTSAENGGQSELVLFSRTKIPLSHWLYIIFLWSIDKSNENVSLLTGFSLRPVISATQRLQAICSLKILHGNIKTGWPRKDSRNQQIYVWPQTQVQPWVDQSRHIPYQIWSMVSILFVYKEYTLFAPHCFGVHI